ncbi:unnamed protein product [Echinostoma caproni]|uniref:Uncharacterized protein n=1 Tax=Echinostoma caproni TaxID=27848 RepID=A0A183A7F0_9TREM|nr:unnamed protein product [Echinostoma caproni]
MTTYEFIVAQRQKPSKKNKVGGGRKIEPLNIGPDENANGRITDAEAKRIFSIGSIHNSLYSTSVQRSSIEKNTIQSPQFIDEASLSTTHSVSLIRPISSTRIDVSRLVTATAPLPTDSQLIKYRRSSPQTPAAGEGHKLSRAGAELSKDRYSQHARIQMRNGLISCPVTDVKCDPELFPRKSSADYSYSGDDSENVPRGELDSNTPNEKWPSTRTGAARATTIDIGHGDEAHFDESLKQNPTEPVAVRAAVRVVSDERTLTTSETQSSPDDGEGENSYTGSFEASSQSNLTRNFPAPPEMHTIHDSESKHLR